VRLSAFGAVQQLLPPDVQRIAEPDAAAMPWRRGLIVAANGRESKKSFRKTDSAAVSG
jgi:hypothetical protein